LSEYLNRDVHKFLNKKLYVRDWVLKEDLGFEATYEIEPGLKSWIFLHDGAATIWSAGEPSIKTAGKPSIY